MKTFLKVVGAIVAILVLVFAALAAYFYFNPEAVPEQRLSPAEEEVNRVYMAVEAKTDNIDINSIDQIYEIIVPLARQLIISSYPYLAGRTIHSLSVLDNDAFAAQVVQELSSRNMIYDASANSTVVRQLQGITFCPASDIYINYLDNGLYTLEHLHTAIHELLHGLTCGKDINVEFGSVWEESFTEYFTMNIISRYIGMNADIASSYPEGLRFMRLLNKFISEGEMFRVYVAKDARVLKKSIDDALGRGSYDALNRDMEIVFSQSDYSYIQDGSVSNPYVDEATLRIEKLLSQDRR